MTEIRASHEALKVELLTTRKEAQRSRIKINYKELS
jgi:hypothetical protein